MIEWYSGLSTGEAVALWVLVYFALATPLAMLLGRLLRRARKTQTRPVNDRKD
jgi:hypothetical protein